MSYNASSTYKTFLMHSTDGEAYTKVIDIVDFGDLGGAPNTIDTTTLTDGQMTSINGLLAGDSIPFNANYDPVQFQALNALATADEAAPSYYAIWFGGTDNAGADPTPTGNLGKFSWRGQMSKPYVTGAGANERRNVAFSISRATPISYSYSAG
jgi:hypothetical protein